MSNLISFLPLYVTYMPITNGGGMEWGVECCKKAVDGILCMMATFHAIRDGGALHSCALVNRRTKIIYEEFLKYQFQFRNKIT